MNGQDFLGFLQSRASVRRFQDQPVPRAALERMLTAATRAPSPTNRQPWRFSVVTSAAVRGQLVGAVHGAIDAIRQTIARGPHPDHLAGYWDYFVRPLESAPAFVVVQYRLHVDTLATLVKDAGADPADFVTCDAWQSELSAASAATMLLLLQARAEGLGACWMSGPLLARARLCEVLRIKGPWRMLGGVAVGWPAEEPAPTPRKPLEKVVEWFEDSPGSVG